ncbi:MAG TPA: TIGR02466 family protein [Povalibacter sp.]
MTTLTLFPTLIHAARLQRTGWQAFNKRLLHECVQLREDDVAGQRWSRKNYPGGYTSYNSVSRMHQVSPTFATLERRLNRHVRAFARSLELDLDSRPLTMTDCWVNIMPVQVVHGLHLHPLSTISGTYYVQTPKGSPGIKFEDPRLDRFMAAPPRKADCRPEHRPWFIVPAEAGTLVLFESWLRHEVAPNPVRAERVSISFNYSWF